ncbi:MAG TPA: choice-of-anchor Q domain-containing protein [Rudaea sp.]
MSRTTRATALSIAICLACGTDAPAEELPSGSIAATAAAVLVTNCADHGANTLRDALENATDGEEIDVMCSSITLTTGELRSKINNVSIVGVGPTRTIIDANSGSRVLKNSTGNYTAPTNLILKNLDLRNGKTRADADTAYDPDNGFPQHGGCISSNGDVSLYNTSLSHCAIRSLGKDSEGHAPRAEGGAIYSTTTVRLFASTISFASAYSQYGGAYGGAIFAKQRINLYPALTPGTLYMRYGNNFVAGTGSAISYSVANSNAASAFGGATYSHAFRAEFSTISGCQANTVGGISATSVLLVGSTVSRNKGTKSGVGGISTTQLVTSNSTIAFNVGSTVGGAEVRNSGNSFASLKDSIFSNSAKYGSASDFPVADLNVLAPITIAGSGNLIQTPPFSVGVPVDTIINQDPLLDPVLGNNGGGTATHLLRSGSPALGVVARSDRLDQRGLPRPLINSDIGSIEETIFKDGLDRPGD